MEVIRPLYVLTVVTVLVLMVVISMGTPSTVLALPPAQEPTPTLTFGDARSQANSLMQEGYKLRSRSEFSGALEYYQRALSIYKEIGDRAGEVHALIAIGFVYQTLGRFHEALECYQESWPEGEARTLVSIGAIYAELGNYQRALQYTQEALSIYKATKDRNGESAALINIGVVYQRLGEYTTALEYFQEALQISRAIDHPAREANALNNIGDTYGHLSAYQKALEYLLKALSIRQAIRDRVGEANTLNNIGVIYLNMGDYEKAIEYFLQGATVSRTIGYRVGEARGLNTVGVILGHLREYRKSLGYSQQALEAVRDIDYPMGEATILTNIGFSYYRLGEYAKALENYQLALSMHRAIGYRVGEAITLGNIGGIYDDLGNYKKALEYHQQALSIHREIGDIKGEIDDLFNIGYIHERHNDYQKAFDHYSQAVAAIEEIRGELTVEELRATFAISGAVVVYEHAIFALIKLNRLDDALNYAERARARTFLDLLGNQRVNPKGSENSQLIEQEEQLMADIIALDRQLRQELAKPADERIQQNVENLTSNLETKRQEYQDLLIKLQLTNPEYATLVSVNPLTLEEAQSLLREKATDVTLVAYFVGKEETVIFVVSQEAFHAQTVSVTRKELRQQKEALLAQMKAAPNLPDAWQVPAQTLYEWLISPVQDYLPPANLDCPPRLGIIPHDLLHYLPFGLLYNGKSTLLGSYTLFYVPSISSLRFIFEKRHPEADTLLAFAVPDAPGASHLYHAVKEVQTIADLYETQPLTGSDASEGRFKAQAGAYGLVHIAAHSDYEPQRPLFSAILLSKDDDEDGRLETHEVFNLDLPQTDLVVLSACETHLGELSSGDELVGLERAFVRAGSPSLLSTLWLVDDAATAALMGRFYTHLQAGVPKAEALRLAQLETQVEHPEPYYWAGFVLVGDAGLLSEAIATPEATPTVTATVPQPTPTTPAPQPTQTEGRDGGLCGGASVLLMAVGAFGWRCQRRGLLRGG